MKPLYEVKVSNIPVVNKILYWKNCYGAAKGYMGMPLDVMQMYFLSAIYLQKYDISEWFIVGVGVVLVMGIFLAGHIIFQKGFMGRDSSIQTEIANPQMMEILEKVRNLEKKL